MSVIGSNILAGASGQAGYFLTKSLRFRSSASAYLNRTLTTPTNNLKWTWSAWVKRGTLGTTNILFNAGDGSSNDFGAMQFTTGDVIQFAQINGGTYNVQVTTNAVFRDPSAWYHVVLVYDSANATSTDRVQIYVNGTRQSVTYITGPFAQNTASKINSALTHYISKLDYTTIYFDGYLAEVNFIDGQALTPSSFGETSTTTGVWIPKKYTGTYGTNGFYLPFTDTTSTSTLGTDFSGNSNTWTVNNISLTAGATYDSMTDVPTLTSATTANYATLNPLDKVLSPTVINGNLSATVGDNAEIRGTIYVSSGKWYWEIIPTTMTFSMIGIGISGTGIHWGSTGVSYYGFNGNKYVNGTSSSYGSSYTNNDVIGVALDLDNLQITFYKNNTSQGTITGLTAGLYTPALSAAGNSSVYNINFGQQPFVYTAPTGFVALNTFNLPTPTIGATASSQANKYMNISLYTGTGSSLSVTGVGFQPDWTWIKGRSGATDHGLYDAVRGVQKQLESNNTDAETTETTGLTAFGSDGFTVGALAQLNTSSATYVGWNWKANGAGSSNTAGSITSTVSANTTAGFSIVTWVHSSTTSTIGHGLGVAPQFIILKSRTTAYNWDVGCNSIGWANRLILNSTGATTSGFWNSTAPTSTVFTYAGSGATNGDNMVAYCFTPIAGYSAMGSYTGNGSADGTFVFLGFRPKFIMVKSSSAAGNGWIMYDTSRNTYNIVNYSLFANESSAENAASLSTENFYDLLSNGFKARTSNAVTNQSSATYIYMAFAENPFKYSNAR